MTEEPPSWTRASVVQIKPLSRQKSMDWKWSLCDPKIVQVLPQTKAFQMRTFIENLWLTVGCFSCSNGKVNQWQKPWTEEPVSPRTTDCRRKRQINIWEEERLAILYTYSCQTLPLINVHKIPVTADFLPTTFDIPQHPRDTGTGAPWIQHPLVIESLLWSGSVHICPVCSLRHANFLYNSYDDELRNQICEEALCNGTCF